MRFRNIVMTALAGAVLAGPFAGAATAEAATAPPARATQAASAALGETAVGANFELRGKDYYTFGTGASESQASYRALQKARAKAREESRNGWRCDVNNVTVNTQTASGTWQSRATVNCWKVIN